MFDTMPEENVFFFNAEGGKTGEKTTQDDLLKWISTVVPENSGATMNQEISMVNINGAVENTGDPALMEFMKQSME